MRIEQLQYLLEIRENHSISKTAEANFISQQSLSKAIKALEQELDTSLYIYQNKKVFLTPAGLLVADYAEQVCKSVKNMRKELQKLNQYSSEQQQIKILSFTALSNLFVSTSYNFFQKSAVATNLIFQNIDSFSVEDAKTLISTSDADLIILTINEDVLNDFIRQIAPYINTYQIILEDTMSTITNCSSNITDKEIYKIMHKEFSRHKTAIFSSLPKSSFQNFRTVSSNIEFIKIFLSQQDAFVTAPTFLSNAFFTKEFRIVPSNVRYSISHVCLYKNEPTPLLEQYVLYIENYLKDMQKNQ